MSHRAALFGSMLFANLAVFIFEVAIPLAAVPVKFIYPAAWLT